MSIWSTLGIEPTKDKRKIKRAYAKMAARYHPEEQPEKFQEVYDAYEMTDFYKPTADSPGEPKEPEPVNEDSIDFDGKIPRTPRQRIVIEDNKEKNQIDFEQLVPDSGRKLMLKPTAEQTINFDSIVREDPPDESQHHKEPGEHEKKNELAGGT